MFLSEYIRKIARSIEKEAARKGFLRLLDRFIEENDLPAKDWPAYVKKELFGKRVKDLDPSKRNLKDMRTISWILSFSFKSTSETIKIRTDLSSFTEESARNIENRLKLLGNESLRVNIKDDEKRHDHQKKELETQEKLINSEPVVVFKSGQKLNLIEGWHRTIQLISEARKRKLKVVKYNAYIGRREDGSKSAPERLVEKLQEFYKFHIKPS
jgi:hypothetical protein